MPNSNLPDSNLYERDFHAWAHEQARLLRAGALESADITHIATEIESMAGTEKRELISRLAVLLMHLLKWEFQPGLRGNSWRAAIKVQRRELLRHLDDNPSLRAKLPASMADAYGDAILNAARETGLDEAAFPARCPWTFEQIAADSFWPASL